MTSAAVSPCGFTFDEATHTYRDVTGVVIASVTQILRSEGFLGFLDKIPPRILERKRRLGTLVHQATALLDADENLDQYDIPKEVWDYLPGYINFRTDCSFEPELIEHRKLGEVYGMTWGMTIDRRGPINGEQHVVEIKCGASEHPAWGLQLAAYELGLKPIKERPRDRRVAVQLGPDFARGYKLHNYDDAKDYTIFTNALANAIWKQNHGLYEAEPIAERLVA